MEAELKNNLLNMLEKNPAFKQNLENHLNKFSLLAFKYGNDGFITEDSLLTHYKNRKFKNKKEREEMLPVIEGEVKAALLALVLWGKAIRVEDLKENARYKFNEKKDFLKGMLLLEKESLVNRLEFINNELRNF